jgi:hypothetical protein
LRNSSNLAGDEFVPTPAPFPRPPGIFSPFTNTIELIRFALYERFGIVEPTGYRMVALFTMPGAASYGCDPALEMMNHGSGPGS